MRRIHALAEELQEYMKNRKGTYQEWWLTLAIHINNIMFDAQIKQWRKADIQFNSELKRMIDMKLGEEDKEIPNVKHDNKSFYMPP